MPKIKTIELSLTEQEFNALHEHLRFCFESEEHPTNTNLGSVFLMLEAIGDARDAQEEAYWRQLYEGEKQAGLLPANHYEKE